MHTIQFHGKKEDDIAILSTESAIEIQCDTPYAFLWMFKELDMFGDFVINSCGILNWT